MPRDSRSRSRSTSDSGSRSRSGSAGRRDNSRRDGKAERSRSRSRSRDHKKKSKPSKRDRSRSRSRSRDNTSKRRQRSSSRDRHSKHKHSKKDKKRKDRSRSRSRDRKDTRSNGYPAAAASGAGAASSSSMVPSTYQPVGAGAGPSAASSGVGGAARVAAMFGYTADDNPFGDPNLNSAFMWKKKIDKDIAQGKLSHAPTAAELAAGQEGMMDEIERARARRRKREAEQEEMERLRAEEARLRDAAQYADWESKEEEFHMKQARTRCLIRIKEQRERPVDAIAKNALVAAAVDAGEGQETADRYLLSEVQLRDPMDVMRVCNAADLEGLVSDVKEFIDVEGPYGTHAGYYKAVLAVAEDEHRRAVVRESGLAAGRSLASLQSVEDEVDAMFIGKTEADLNAMEEEIKGVIAGGSAASSSAAEMISISGLVQQQHRGGAVDVEYWQGVLAHLRTAMAKAVAKRLFEEHLLMRLRQMDTSGAGADMVAESTAAAAAQAASFSSSAVVERGAADGNASSAAAASESGLPASGKIVTAADARLDEITRRLVALRTAGIVAPKGGEAAAAGGADEGDAAAVIQDETGRVLPSGVGETVLGAEAEVQLPVNAKQQAATKRRMDEIVDVEELERYKPRKPRYFNRVKTGYDWNSYNKTHYDHDNPPPKSVQGYKFNVFYPDLLDRTRTPTFIIEPADSSEYVILRFRGGPPYEDIAFKIVNREWDHGRKSGFRCSFDRGILQLFFNFKRYRYRK